MPGLFSPDGYLPSPSRENGEEVNKSRALPRAGSAVVGNRPWSGQKLGGGEIGSML